MSKFLKALTAAVVFFVGTALFILFLAVSAIDPDKYRGDIAAKLSEATGRTVMLEGPLSFGLSLKGAVLTIKEAAIANPVWASRKKMASLGEMRVGLALAPLFHKKIEFTNIDIVKADIGLETNMNGDVNWQLGSATPVEATTAASGEHGTPVNLDIAMRGVTLSNSKLFFRDKDGKMTELLISHMNMATEGNSTAIAMEGQLNGEDLKAELTAGTADLMHAEAWPFKAEASYGPYRLTTDGQLDKGLKALDLASYKVVAGKSDVGGKMSFRWATAKPLVDGTVTSSYFDVADFKLPAKEDSAPAADAMMMAPAPTTPKLFSDAALPLEGMKSVDAELEVKLDDVVAGKATLKNVAGKVSMTSGRLLAEFPAVQLGASVANLRLMLDGGNTPAQFETAFSAPDVDFADLLPLMGMSDFLSGKASANLSVTSTGNSMHALAAGANGTMTVLSNGGQLLSDKVGELYSGLSQLVAPGMSGSVGMNCLAARFNITNGLIKDNGILADTTATTIKVGSAINLGEETLEMVVNARPKISKVGDLVPPVHVAGPLLAPAYTVDAGSAAMNVVGLLVGAGTTSSVPTVRAVEGQNACLYALDHSTASASKASPQLKITDKVHEKVNKLSGKLLKGLFGQ